MFFKASPHKLTQFLTVIFGVVIITLSPARAQQRTVQLQSYADAASLALFRQVAAAYRGVKGIQFVVKRGALEPIHVAVNLPNQARLWMIPHFGPRAKDEFLFDGKNLFTIGTYESRIYEEDKIYKPEDKPKYKKMNLIRYIKDEGEAEFKEVPAEYLSARLFSPILFDALSLVQGKNEILSPHLEPGSFIQQNVKRLPSQIIGGHKMDGVQIRRRRGAVERAGAKPFFGSSDTRTFWFDASDHLLRRCQISSRRPAFVLTETITQVEINPAFPPSYFQFVPPLGAVRTDEDGEAIATVPTHEQQKLVR